MWGGNKLPDLIVQHKSKGLEGSKAHVTDVRIYERGIIKEFSIVDALILKAHNTFRHASWVKFYMCRR